MEGKEAQVNREEEPRNRVAEAATAGTPLRIRLPDLQHAIRHRLAVVHAAHLYGVEKLLYLGSSCIYPKHAEQPIREEALLQGPLEPTNEAYAVAKIAGIKLCQAYRKQYGFNGIFQGGDVLGKLSRIVGLRG